MMAILQVAVALGIVFGFILMSIVLRLGESWKVTLYIQPGIALLFAIITIFIPAHYFSNSLVRAKNELFQDEEKLSEQLIDYDAKTVFQDIEKESKVPACIALVKSLPHYLKNPIYMFSILGLANLFFLITLFQFWGPDYMKTVLKFSINESELSFVIISITSAPSGVIVGGILCNKVGGYEDKRSSLLSFILGCIAGLCILIVPFLNSFYPFAIMIWLVLFFGSCCLPALTGDRFLF